MREWLKLSNPNTANQQAYIQCIAEACYGYYAKVSSHASSKDALTPTEFTTTVTSDGTTPVEGVKVVFKNTGSTVVRYDGLTDTNGQAKGALRADGGKKYDLYITVDGYEPYFEADLTPAEATKTVTLTAIVD